MRVCSNQWRHCLSQLAHALGPESATLELKWMMQAVEQQRPADQQRASDTLSAMVARRVSGEPLQYILGEWPPLATRQRSFSTSTPT